MKESYKISGRSRKKLDNERRRAIKEIVLDMVKRKFPNTTLTIDGVDKEFKKYDLKKLVAHICICRHVWYISYDVEKAHIYIRSATHIYDIYS
jgi:hypothetical protein